MLTGGEQAKIADMMDLTLSFYDLSPTDKSYSPGLAPIQQGVKYVTGMPADRYGKIYFNKWWGSVKQAWSSFTNFTSTSPSPGNE